MKVLLIMSKKREFCRTPVNSKILTGVSGLHVQSGAKRMCVQGLNGYEFRC
jgi:hypothetical protein